MDSSDVGYADFHPSLGQYQAGLIGVSQTWANGLVLFHNGAVNTLTVVYMSPTDDRGFIAFANANTTSMAELDAIINGLGARYPSAPPTPCTGVCTSPTPISWTGSYQGNGLGTGARCYETTQTIAGGNCGNFAAGRELSINGTPQSCAGGNWTSIPAPVNGGYCIEVEAGDFAWAYMTLW